MSYYKHMMNGPIRVYHPYYKIIGRLTVCCQLRTTTIDKALEWNHLCFNVSIFGQLSGLT